MVQNTMNQTKTYVTFSKSEYAYNAFIASRFQSFTVLPANTWHQPCSVYYEELNRSDRKQECRCTNPKNCYEGDDYSDDDEEDDTDDSDVENNMLNKMAAIAMAECDLPIIFEVNINPNHMALKRIRENLRGNSMKSRLECLMLKYQMQPEGDLENCISNEQYFKRVVQVLAISIGQQYHDMSISGVDALSIQMLKDLAPLLRPLKVLSLKTKSNASILYVLSEFCPIISVVIITANSWEGECIAAIPQHWPSISTLVIKGKLTIDSDTEIGIKFQRFIGMNKHLNMLHLDVVVDYRLCKVIAKNLKSLKTLTIARETYDGIIPILDVFDTKHLTNISFIILNVDKNGFGEMINCTRRLRQMKKLKSATLIQNFDSETLSREEQFNHLVSLVKYHENCQCHAPDRVVEFNFDEMDEVNLPRNNKPVLVTIVNVKSTIQPIEQAKIIIDAFKKTMQFYPNKIKTIKLDIDDYCKFINVCST